MLILLCAAAAFTVAVPTSVPVRPVRILVFCCFLTQFFRLLSAVRDVLVAVEIPRPMTVIARETHADL